MDLPDTAVARAATVARYGRVAALVVLAVSALNWVGWSADIEVLIRVHPSWPRMTPWTALWLAALALAILLQTGHPPHRRIRTGQTVAALVGVLAAVVLLEYLIARPLGLDQIWFHNAVHRMTTTWPGRPSPQTATSVLLVAAAVGLTRVDRDWTDVAWPVCMLGGGAIPFISGAAYLLDAAALVSFTSSTGQALPTALALLLLVGATSAARPDRLPMAWLLARPDRMALLRLAGVLAGFPIVVALSRLALRVFHLDDHATWTVSIAVGTLVVGALTFYLSQREQGLLIEKELVSSARADAEQRYRILADNAVDVIVHLRGRQVVWISPSVEAAFGGPPEQWIGSELRDRVHPDDLESLGTVLERIADGAAVRQRFRISATDGEHHWVDGHGKPYVDADGNSDGVIAALRIIDDQVEAEQRLERLARFDTLTGLANRAEAIGRLESALQRPPALGTHLGILFCDVDRFKEINDTWGHAVGDAVLTALGARIVDCVRSEDTVGRTGGDEILVLLPGIQSIDEAAQIAERIRRRAAEPIPASGHSIHATLSIGVTVAVPGDQVLAITTRADAAMYRAKLGSKNGVTRIEAG